MCACVHREGSRHVDAIAKHDQARSRDTRGCRGRCYTTFAGAAAAVCHSYCLTMVRQHVEGERRGEDLDHEVRKRKRFIRWRRCVRLVVSRRVDSPFRGASFVDSSAHSAARLLPRRRPPSLWLAPARGADTGMRCVAVVVGLRAGAAAGVRTSFVSA